MSRPIYYQYYVEGEDEVKLLNVLKSDLGCILAGKVDKFTSFGITYRKTVFSSLEMMQKKLKRTRLSAMDQKTGQQNPNSPRWPVLICPNLFISLSQTFRPASYSGNTVIIHPTDTTQQIKARSQDCLNMDFWSYPP